MKNRFFINLILKNVYLGWVSNHRRPNGKSMTLPTELQLTYRLSY
jgi:hypothetical protein